MERRKPLKADPAKTRAWQDRSRKPLQRGEFWKTRTGQLRRKTALKKRNEERIARRKKEYDRHIHSAEWLKIRYERFLFDNGMCQCEWCVEERKNDPMGVIRDVFAERAPAGWQRMEAHMPIPVWYTAKGGAPWRRIRGFSTHHVRYRKPEQLKDLRTMYPLHHDLTEAKYSTRRRYLQGSK